MSTLSKVFVVLNLILSIVFATFVTNFYKHAQNWRDKHDKLQADTTATIQSRDAKLKEAGDAIESFKKDLAEQRRLYFELQAERERLQSEKDTLAAAKMLEEDKNRSLTSEIARINALLSRASEDNRRLQEEQEQGRLAKEAAIREMERAQDAAHEWQIQAGDKDTLLLELRERIQGMGKELAQYNMVLQEMAHQGVPVERYVLGATPLIEGRVTGVRGGVVMISVGHDDQVREGYEFTVYRGDRYLCKIRVEKTFPDESAGEVLPDSLSPEAGSDPGLQVNDHVTTRP